MLLIKVTSRILSKRDNVLLMICFGLGDGESESHSCNSVLFLNEDRERFEFGGSSSQHTCNINDNSA